MMPEKTMDEFILKFKTDTEKLHSIAGNMEFNK
jgi:hypothetical protein